MKKRQCKGILYWMILGTIVMLLAGCKGTVDSSQSSEDGAAPSGVGEEPSQEAVKVLEKLELAGELAELNLNDIACNGQTLYLYGTESLEADNGNSGYGHYIVCCDIDGTIKKKTLIYEEQIEEQTLNSTFSVGYWIRLTEMNVTENDELLVLFQGTENSNSEYQMVKFDGAGNELWRTVIGETVDVGSSLVCTEEEIYINNADRISVYGQNGELKRVITPGVLPDGIDTKNLIERIEAIAVSDDGQAYITYRNKATDNRIVVEINPENGELGAYQEVVPEDRNSFWHLLDGRGSGYELLVINGGKLYGLDFGEEADEIVDWESIGIDSSHLDYIQSVGAWMYLLYESASDTIYQLNMTGGAAVKRQTITIAASSITEELKERVLAFNQTSDRWKVKVVTYAFFDEAVLTQFNLDLVNGQVPDILWLDETILYMVPYENYGNQGMFEDLKVWFEQDPELAESDYLTNVFDALGKDGRWTRLCMEFAVKTWFGKTSVLGEVDSITLDELGNLGNKYGSSVVMSARREANIKQTLITRWDQFVNEEDGSCRFDSDEFVQVLKVLKNYPGEGDPMRYHPQNMRWDELLLMGVECDSFRKWIEYPAEWSGEDYTIVGYPSASGNGGMIVPKGSTISMFADSDCKEGAWEFIRYFLADEYQSEIGIEGEGRAFRVKRSALEKQLEAALNPAGLSYGYDYEGEHVNIPTPTRDEMEAWVDYMSNITCAELVDREVYNIIIEEAGAFFAGQKTAEEVAKIIQNRVWIYLAEQQ